MYHVGQELGNSNENLSLSHSSRNGVILLQRIPHGGEKTLKSNAQIKITWPHEKFLGRSFLWQECMIIALFRQ